jgi:hypothetical protein
MGLELGLCERPPERDGSCADVPSSSASEVGEIAAEYSIHLDGHQPSAVAALVAGAVDSRTRAQSSSRTGVGRA